MAPTLLVNWLGHSAGAVVFGLFLWLLARDGSAGRNKAAAATLLAFVWNGAGLIGLGRGGETPGLAALESTAFSLLPALLFDLVIGGSPRWAVRTGYAISLGATVLHLAELVSDSAVLHGAGLYLVAVGFAALAVYAAVRSRNRALPALALLLLSLSILHFAEGQEHGQWWAEVVVHHAAIPLAMFVLLQDYRFVLLDALIRFLANILVALVFAAAGISWVEKWPSTALAGLAGLFILYALARVRVQTLLTRLVFGRPDDLAGLLASIRPGDEEGAFLDDAERRLREYFSAGGVEPGEEGEAVLDVRLAVGDTRRLRLGRRPGGRRYLSEDLAAIEQVGVRIRDCIEEMRAREMRRLVAEAELRALQAQIHPHFLFNAFNTLYGIIPKEAAGARETVLNLAEIFRYLLRTDQTFVSLQEEINVVKSYLEVENLRLGARLRAVFDVDSELLGVRVPLLSIEPLVENAVKHGIAGRAEGGEVRVSVGREGDRVLVQVADTGGGFPEGAARRGVGLENVRQRLRLCYGAEAELEIASSPAGATVRFRVPLLL
jgi:two-component system, LytTR family, sensor kinase